MIKAFFIINFERKIVQVYTLLLLTVPGNCCIIKYFSKRYRNKKCRTHKYI